MTRTTLVIGGAGQIGQAVCRRLLADGWDVVAAQKHAGSLPAEIESLGARPVTLDREQPGAVARAVGAGVDALIDTVAYDESHAAQLLAIEGDVGALVVVSSASVYRDAKGRTIDEAAQHGFPALPVPIGEDQPTVAAGSKT